MSKVKIDPLEVGALAWFERSKIKDIVAVKEDQTNVSGTTNNTEMFKYVV